jgi:N-acetylmuramoyl-L-alanine amidase
MSEKVIVTRAGHGGQSPGAVHPPYTEKDETLKVDAALAAALAQKYNGYRLIRARPADVTLSLADGIETARREGADVYIDIHLNAGGGTGPETYVALTPTAADLGLARAVHGALYGYLGPTFKVPDRGIKRVDFYVLRYTRDIPSILVEILFLDHSVDRAAISSPGFYDAVGEALADGVAAFLGLSFRETQEERVRELEEKVAQLEARDAKKHDLINKGLWHVAEAEKFLREAHNLK